jgi:hypothetical protein
LALGGGHFTPSEHSFCAAVSNALPLGAIQTKPMNAIKKTFLTLSFLFAFSCFCFGQDKKEVGFQLTFNEYKIDSCLYDVLEAIVETDSAQTRFPPDVYFYNLSYGNYVHYRDIIIRPTRWYKDLPHDTKGVIVIDGAKFVLMGRLDSNSLFKRTGKTIDISVKFPVPKVFDTLDNRQEWLGWEKSPTAFVGSVKFCGTPPIGLHVDIYKKIERLSFAGK